METATMAVKTLIDGKGELAVKELNRITQNGRIDPFAIPYTTSLCLDPLIQQIEQLAGSSSKGEAFLAREVMRRVEQAPELRSQDLSLDLAKLHQETIELIMLFLFPAGTQEESMFKVTLPFQFEAIYESPALTQLMAMEGVYFCLNNVAQKLNSVNIIQACLVILNRCYGKKIELSPVTLIKVPDAQTNLLRYYKPAMNQEYIRVTVNGELPPLAEEDYQRLLSNIYDMDLWLELLPPAVFSFHGFMFGQLTDVTEQESLGSLKHKLIRRDAVLDIEKVRELADLLRIHFRMPELKLGLTAIDFPTEFRVNHQYKIHYDLLSEVVDNLASVSYAKSIYHRAFKFKEVLLVEDLTNLKEKTELEERLIGMGFRSVLLAPLLNQEERVIGLVELASPEPYAINSFLEIRFREIMSLFRTAVARSREEVDNRLEAILREQYTSLHPSVEWRFIEAAYEILEQRSAGLEVAPMPIQFESVYPLYGQADIVNSSNQRNEAIHADLVENLHAARLVLVRALDLIDFPLISQVVLEIDQALAIQADNFNNSDETRIVEFLFSEVHPLIAELGKDYKFLSELSRQYLAKLDKDLQLIYRRRKDYEDSVNKLNKELSRYFEAQDRESQKTIPHYFEKYKTDGVEYELYAGQSLLRDHTFSNIHLRNLRLTQLIDMCGATRLVEAVTNELPLKLQTAQLVFAYTSPINIHFRMDEKRFDVDGAYNVRYEILKKRIDKATVKNGTERLTLAGMVSIVYLHEKDKKEYLGYVDYLRQSGYIDGEVEEFTLDPLQSVQGLKALRFRVAV